MSIHARHRGLCRSAFGLIAVSLIWAAGAVGATTMVTLSGAGDLTIQADGQVYLDFSQSRLTRLRITTDSTLTLSRDARPASLSGPIDMTSVYSGLMGTQNLVFASPNGDVVFDSLAWNGSLTVVAAGFFGFGPIFATESIVLAAGGDLRVKGSTPGAATRCSAGNTSGGAIVLGSGTTISIPCLRSVIGPGLMPIPTGGLQIGSGTLVSAVPEPAAALLFVAGFSVFLESSRRVARHRGSASSTESVRRLS